MRGARSEGVPARCSVLIRRAPVLCTSLMSGTKKGSTMGALGRNKQQRIYFIWSGLIASRNALICK